MRTMPLHDYLLAQIERDDPVGALARDYATATTTGQHPEADTVTEYREQLHKMHAPAAAHYALTTVQHELHVHARKTGEA